MRSSVRIAVAAIAFSLFPSTVLPQSAVETAKSAFGDDVHAVILPGAGQLHGPQAVVRGPGHVGTRVSLHHRAQAGLGLRELLEAVLRQAQFQQRAGRLVMVGIAVQQHLELLPGQNHMQEACSANTLAAQLQGSSHERWDGVEMEVC